MTVTQPDNRVDLDQPDYNPLRGILYAIPPSLLLWGLIALFVAWCRGCI